MSKPNFAAYRSGGHHAVHHVVHHHEDQRLGRTGPVRVPAVEQHREVVVPMLASSLTVFINNSNKNNRRTRQYVNFSQLVLRCIKTKCSN